MDEIPVTRVALAVFRGSEEPAKCRHCGAAMDTMLAYCGEPVDAKTVRREDPKF